MPVRLLGALVPAGSSPVTVQLVDLSRGGACCQAFAPVPVGTEVELRLDGLSASAIVCWTRQGTCGLRFVRPIRATEILLQVGKSRPRDADGLARTRFFAPPQRRPALSS